MFAANWTGAQAQGWKSKEDPTCVSGSGTQALYPPTDVPGGPPGEQERHWSLEVLGAQLGESWHHGEWGHRATVGGSTEVKPLGSRLTLSYSRRIAPLSRPQLPHLSNEILSQEAGGPSGSNGLCLVQRLFKVTELGS